MKKIIFSLIILILIIPSITSARSGCCSHHLGVKSNGCGCNDGTPLSATCAPYYSCTATTYQPEPIAIPAKDPIIEPILPVIVESKPPVVNTVKVQIPITTPTVKVAPSPIKEKPIIPEIKTKKEEIKINEPQKQSVIIPTITETKRPIFIKRFFNWLF